MTTTRGRGYSSRREILSSPKRSKRLKQSDPNQSELPAIVDDVVEDQGDASASANDVSDHEKKRESWFDVNGIPIRCSIREHALVTGFDCRDYVSDYNASSFGSYDFVERVFGTRGVTVSDVEKMLQSMEDACGRDRLQVAVLLFLCTIVKGGRRFNSIQPFVLKIVNDLEEDIMERGEAEDSLDHIADAWTERLDVQHKKICWEDLHKMDVDYRGCGEGHNLAAEQMEEPQQNVPAAEQKEEELLAPYLLNRMVKTAVAETMKDVYLRLEKLESAAEGRKDGEEAETSEKTEDLSTRLEKLERAAEARKAKGKDEEEKETSEKTQDLRTDWDEAAWFEKSVELAVVGGFEKIGDDTLDDESDFEKNVEPAVGGDDTLDDECWGRIPHTFSRIHLDLSTVPVCFFFTFINSVSLFFFFPATLDPSSMSRSLTRSNSFLHLCLDLSITVPFPISHLLKLVPPSLSRSLNHCPVPDLFTCSNSFLHLCLDLSITVPFLLLSVLVSMGLHFLPSQSQSCF
ncbi:hypothetical protein ISN44_As08g031920 [Arabidopsis suecica]|uniref:DUF1985 domain-containing protein n=1 Tax=Arabidopsis suecica TaxID=45249 RepID=A0A8T2BCA6_ARASU|nr:hypothetical protein ISN44_As08g031920 [Arabidopsis suecica]KAG7583674.1 hypothetical protein ISN44_As08g031920 [Arabidopsis suecica]KAG7583675.1 hypothetical protein ISN44_As08g031920 [Arabidopsis suecica]